MQQKLSHYIRLDTNSHSDSEGSTSGIGTATDNAYHILPASDSPVSSYRFSSSTTTSLVYSNGNVGRMSTPSFHNSTIYTLTHTNIQLTDAFSLHALSILLLAKMTHKKQVYKPSKTHFPQIMVTNS